MAVSLPSVQWLIQVLLLAVSIAKHGDQLQQNRKLVPGGGGGNGTASSSSSSSTDGNLTITEAYGPPPPRIPPSQPPPRRSRPPPPPPSVLPVPERPKPAHDGSIPSWVKYAWNPKNQKQVSLDDQEANQKAVEKLGRAGKTPDFVLMGDSNTRLCSQNRSQAWDLVFADKLAEPLGVGGATVRETAWRLVFGGERPDPPPKVLALLVGYNDVRWGGAFGRDDPVPDMDWLLGWVTHDMPSTQVILMGLLPNNFISLESINRRYEGLAQQYGVRYYDCCSDLDPSDESLFYDGTHITPQFQVIMLRRLRRVLDQSGYL